MVRTLGVIDTSCAARDASRFHRMAMCLLGGHSLLTWIVRRVTDAQRLDDVVVVLAGSKSAAATIRRLVPADVSTYASHKPEPLARILDALDRFPAEAIVRVGLDNPFVDPELIDGLVRESDHNPSLDYISYRSNDGRPVVLSKLGLFAEWCRVSALRTANMRVATDQDPQLFTRYLFSHPELFRLRFMRVPEQLDRTDVRLTLDKQEDWENVEEIIDALGPEGLDWRGIANLLDQHPSLRRRMAQLNRSAATSAT